MAQRGIRLHWGVVLAIAATVFLLAVTAGWLAAGAASTRPAATKSPDFLVDPNNCGGIGLRVPPGDVCRDGLVTSPSPSLVYLP